MNQIKTGAIISYMSLGINILTGLFYTPWMITSIGRENFGLYTLALSVISLFVFDFGLSAAVTRFIAKYVSLGEQDKANNILGIAFKLYIYIDIILLIGLVVLFYFIPMIYAELLPDEIEKFKVVYVIAAVFSVISFPFIPINGVLTAHEKIVQLKIADVAQKLLILISMTIALSLGLGLYTLVLINALAGIICIGFKLWGVYTYTPQKVNWNYSNRSEMKSLSAYSGWISVLALAQRCIFNMAPSILGIVSGSSAIAILGIAITIEGYSFTFANALNGIFLPKVSRILLKEKGSILPLMIKVGRIQLIIILFILISFICFGADFICLWVGHDFKDSYMCAVLLIIPSMIHLPQMIGSEAIYAMNEVKHLSGVYIIMALFNLIGAFTLSPIWGALGIAISICVAYLIRTIGMDYILYKKMGIDVICFFRNTFVKMLPVGILTAIVGILLASYIDCTKWGGLVLGLILLFVFYVLSLYKWSLDSAEKELLHAHISKIKKIIQRNS